MRTAHRVAVLAAVTAALSLSALGVAQAAPAMWEVSDADSKVTLFGSVHVLPPGVEWRTPAFDAALEAAPEVYFETDIGPWGEIALTLKLLGSELSSMRDHWTDRLTPEELQKLKDATERAGIKLETAEITPPWALEVQLQMAAMTPGNEKLDPFKGVDPILEWALPKERKAFFETPGQQYDFLASDPLDVQIKRLMVSIDAMTSSAPPTLDTIVAAWANGDVDAIAATNVPQNADDVVDNQRLLLDRNASWIPVIERMLADNRQDLVVVGAAHLAGPGSVLDLLAKAGYTVTRIQ
jgi:uncharacterized protein YbaP (TraB family)